MVDRITDLLLSRGAQLGEGVDCGSENAAQRIELARIISRRYREFDGIRHALTAEDSKSGSAIEDPGSRKFLEAMASAGFARRSGQDYTMPEDPQAVRFLTGVWLEELAYRAVLEAGADGAVCGQVLEWASGPYQGRSEVDVIARKDERLLFVSCKTGKPDFSPAAARAGQNQRRRMMDDLHATDNLVDHFGTQRDVAALIVTTDLIDEAAGYRVRYEAIFGKALALNVELIGLEELPWEKLVERFRVILSSMG